MNGSMDGDSLWRKARLRLSNLADAVPPILFPHAKPRIFDKDRMSDLTTSQYIPERICISKRLSPWSQP